MYARLLAAKRLSGDVQQSALALRLGKSHTSPACGAEAEGIAYLRAMRYKEVVRIANEARDFFASRDLKAARERFS